MQRTLLEKYREFRRFWKHYLFQSFLAMVVILIILLFLKLQNVVVVASIGSTAFIVFAIPNSITARPVNVIGGHLIGLIAGSLCAFIPQTLMIHSLLVYSLAVGVSIFVMVVVDAEHPPASGTALGVAMTGFSWSIATAVVTAAIVLSLIHVFCRKYIRNLV